MIFKIKEGGLAKFEEKLEVLAQNEKEFDKYNSIFLDFFLG